MTRGGLTERQFAFLLVLPALCLLGFVSVYPLIHSLVLGFTDASLLKPSSNWVGFTNYSKLFHSPHFYRVLWNTAVFVVGATSLSFLIGFALALFLDHIITGKGILRGACLLPWLLSPIVVSFLWMWIFNTHYGVLNGVLRQLGIIDKPLQWLSNPSTAMLPIIIAKTWQSFPWVMAILLGALQTVSREQIEAARIDGAGDWRIIRYIALPHMKPVIQILLILSIMWNLQHFDTIWVMTQGGPVGATTTLSVEVYKKVFFEWDSGSAGALGSVWMVLVVILVGIYFMVSGFAKRGTAHGGQ
jgi:multiple sugar transport system permease protein